jgi:hypothetical protein
MQVFLGFVAIFTLITGNPIVAFVCVVGMLDDDE